MKLLYYSKFGLRAYDLFGLRWVWSLGSVWGFGHEQFGKGLASSGLYGYRAFADAGLGLRIVGFRLQA